MKYYVFLSGLVLVMSFQNCSQSNFSETSGNTLIEGLVDGTGSTDTGNGGNDNQANMFIQDIAEFTYMLCAKNEVLSGADSYNCQNELSTASYYNQISEGVEFNSVSEYLEFARAGALKINTPSMIECQNYIITYSPETQLNDVIFLDEVLRLPACNRIIIPVPGFVY